MTFITNLEDELNIKDTENGAIGYSTTKSALLDFSFKIPSYRGDFKNLYLDFQEAYNENKELALKFLFYMRDIREGLGERDIFRKCLSIIADDLDNRVFDWIMEYGRADDLFIFFDTSLETQMLEFVKNTLIQDNINALEGKEISLLAKWMPSINTSSKKTTQLASRFIKYLEMTPKLYRKMLSKLRSYLDVVEKKMCARQFKEIEYAHVPSYANLKYRFSFLKHDKARRQKYLDALQEGKTKINSSTAFPHDIVHRYDVDSYAGSHNGKDITLEEMWKALPRNLISKPLLVVRDGSGSMTSTIPNSSATALDVSTALAIFFSEQLTGEFNGKFITFSNRPKFINLQNYKSLYDKLLRCYQENDCSNTDIEKTMLLVLDVAKKNNLKQEEIPDILIISDMEFDGATTTSPRKTLFDNISDIYKESGYILPKIIFWNVNSRTNTIPLVNNKLGVILISGYSVNLMEMILSTEINPYKSLLNILNKERYSKITFNK